MRSIITGLLMSCVAMPAMAAQVVRPAVENEVLADVEVMLKSMRNADFDYHNCGPAPAFPNDYESKNMRRFADKSDDWYTCISDYIAELRYSARNTSSKLDAMLVEVDMSHPIRERVARAIEVYNRRSENALNDAQNQYKVGREEAIGFIEAANQAIEEHNDELQRRESKARLMAQIECAGEQVIHMNRQTNMSTMSALYNPYAYQPMPYVLPSSNDTEYCISRKIQGLPSQYQTFYWQPPTWSYIPSNEVRISIDSYGNLPAGSHVDFGFNVPDDDRRH